MTNNNFVLYSIDNAPAASANILTAVQNTWGFVPNLHKVMAASPAAIEAYSTLWTLAERTSLSAVERNIAYLAIIYENECDYCMAGHTNLSKMAGVDAEHITAVREGKVIADTKLEALRQFAALITKNRGFVTEQQVEAFKAAGYSNESVLDLLVLAATKLLSNYTNHLARTPLDSFMKGAEWQVPAAK